MTEYGPAEATTDIETAPVIDTGLILVLIVAAGAGVLALILWSTRKR